MLLPYLQQEQLRHSEQQAQEEREALLAEKAKVTQVMAELAEEQEALRAATAKASDVEGSAPASDFVCG